MKIKKIAFQSMLFSSVFLGLVSCSLTQHTDFENELVHYPVVEEVEQTNTVYYLCAKKPLVVYFHADKADLVWQQESYPLTQSANASDMLFVGDGLSFWLQGESATLKLNKMTGIHCQVSRIES